jgi:hypothetical protein
MVALKRQRQAWHHVQSRQRARYQENSSRSLDLTMGMKHFSHLQIAMVISHGGNLPMCVAYLFWLFLLPSHG